MHAMVQGFIQLHNIILLLPYSVLYSSRKQTETGNGVKSKA